MGRKAEAKLTAVILQTVYENDGQLRAADIARRLNLHPYQVSRLLPVIDAGQKKWLCEDDEGHLSIYRE